MRSLINKVRDIKQKIKNYINHSSSEKYISFLRSKGCAIGQGTTIRAKTALIDDSRPSLVSIGRNCYINEYFTLLTHDYVTHVFLYKYGDFIPSSGRVTIGNNVSFGRNVTVLKGVTIGNNCFIGAGSIVTKDIPDNSIAAGIPCKVIMTLDEYYKKRCGESLQEAFDYARSIKERFGRRPVPGDFWEEFGFFVSGADVGKYPEIPFKWQLLTEENYQKFCKEHKAPYNSFEEFLKAAGV